MQQRYYWGDFLAEMRRALIRSEDDVEKKLSAQKPGVEVGIWIEQMTSRCQPWQCCHRRQPASAGGHMPPMECATG